MSLSLRALGAPIGLLISNAAALGGKGRRRITTSSWLTVGALLLWPSISAAQSGLCYGGCNPASAHKISWCRISSGNDFNSGFVPYYIYETDAQTAVNASCQAFATGHDLVLSSACTMNSPAIPYNSTGSDLADIAYSATFTDPDTGRVVTDGQRSGPTCVCVGVFGTDAQCYCKVGYEWDGTAKACVRSCPCDKDLVAGQCVQKAPNPKATLKSNGDWEIYQYTPNNQGKQCPPIIEKQKKCTGNGQGPGVGNPVQCSTGVKTHSETDYAGVGPGALSFSRHYSSDNANPWQTAPGPTLTFKTEFGVQLAIVERGNDLRLVFVNTTGTWDDPFADGDTLTSGGGIWSYRRSSGTIWRFDSAGQYSGDQPVGGSGRTVTRTSNPEGGYSETVTNDFGRSLRADYGADGKLLSLTDPAGQLYRYAYDAQGNVSAVIYPDDTPDNPDDNPRKQYLYEDPLFPQALTGIVDENGTRYATYAYDAQGRAVLTEHAGGAEKFTFDYQGPDLTVVRQWTDAESYQEKIYRHSKIGGADRVTSITNLPCPGCAGNGEQESWLYAASGHLSQATNKNGVVTTYQRNERELEISRTEGVGTGQERTVATVWHDSYGLPLEINEPGRRTRFTYDANGNKLTETITDTATGESRTTTYSYTVQGLLESINGPRTDVTDVTTYVYDPQGNITQITNALDHATQITAHDAHGNPTRVVDANGVEAVLTYDLRQRIKTRTVAGATTTYDYDSAGLLIKVTEPDASFLRYTYDGAHRLTDIQDGQGNKIHYTLDAFGNRIREEVFDPTNALRRTHSQVYDSLGRLKEIRGANGQLTAYGYDAQGNRISQTEAGQFSTVYQHDALNRVRQFTDAANGVTQYDYDTLDRLTAVVDPKGLRTEYTHDALGNLKQQRSPDTGTTSYTHDAAGNIQTRTDARGITVGYSYDAANRITAVDYPGTAEDVAYRYDGSNYSGTVPHGIGRLTGIQDAAGTTTFLHDAHGNVTEERRAIGSTTYATRYSYDAADRLIGVTYPTGRPVTYERDALGRVSRVTTVENGQTRVLADAIAYLPFGGLQRYTLGNGIQVTRSYDQDYRLQAQQDQGSAVIRQLNLHNDNRNNLEATEDLVNADQSQSFTYDALARLSAAAGAYGARAYAYDGVGNRTTETRNGTQDSYAYPDTSHRLSKISGGTTASFSYDDAGNATQKNTLGLIYNAAHRLAEVTDNGQIKARYTYTAHGQRAAKTLYATDLAGNTTAVATVVFHYDAQGQLLAETDPDGRTIREYLHLDGQPLALTARRKPAAGSGAPPAAEDLLSDGGLTPPPTAATPQPELFFFHTDHLGTPQKMTDRDQTIVWAATYEPFGQVTMETELVVQPLRFAGQYYDAETGLHDNWWRTYDPAIGRYLQSDPIGLAAGPNTYAYVDSNPLRYTDPAGLNPAAGCIAGSWAGPAGCGVGAGIGTAVMGAAALAALMSTPSDTAMNEECTDKKPCPPCKTVSGKIVPEGTIAYRPLDTPPPGKIEHGIAGPHYNIYKANQNPNNCQCFWQPQGAVPPSALPPGAIPIEPFAN